MNEVTTPIALAHLEPSALTARLYEIRKQERTLIVEFLQYLAEVERRKVHVAAGYSSVFAFLTRYLGYTSSAAYRRMKAAQLLARFPAAGPYLADGRLCVTTLVELRDVLDDATHLATLERAAGKTEDEVKLLAATMRPKPAPPEMLRRLPASPPAPREVPSISPSTAGPAVPPAPPRLEPISEELRVLRVTIGRDFFDDLQAVRAALSHQIPDGSLERVLHECLRRVRRDLERRREGKTDRPRQPHPRSDDARPVSAAVRREVFKRDGGRCAYVGDDGHVCGSTFQVELHHIHPYGRGGPPTAANVALMCSVHNRFLAERDYGADHMARAIAGARDQRAAQRQLSLV